ncbi:response regulator [Desulfovibrio sp.]|uniref:response regulator n=1 Tax=Desulfovibrio sp. TaxID=885 RepID=UPI0025C1BA98|nr:response regulator [Desulfovibrio sp.]
MQKHILLVDSDAESLSRMSQVLRQSDYQVSVACNCDESLNMVRSLKPDCIIFDVELEGTSGTIMYSRLRRNPQTRHIPAIVCTSVGPRPVCFGTGISVLNKSCTGEALLGAVSAATA